MFCRFLDESLRWLVANGKHKEIENQIRKAAKINNTDYNTVVENIQVSKEINVIHNKNMDEEEDRGVVLTVDNEGKAEVQKYTVFTVLKHRRILMVSVVLWIAWYGFGQYLILQCLYIKAGLMPVIDIMLSCKTQIKTLRRPNPKIHCYLSMIQRYITNDDKKHLKMHQAIEKQYSYIKYYYIKSR